MFISLFFLSSCLPILRKIKGVDQPRVETVASINKYATSIGLDTMHVLFPKDEHGFKLISKYLITGNDLLAFDKERRFIPYKSNESGCSGPIELVLSNICQLPDKGYTTVRKVSFDSLQNALSDPNGCLLKYDLKSYDMVAFIQFSKFLRGQNLEVMPIYLREIAKTPENCNVLFLYIAFEYMDTFGYPAGKKIKLKLGRSRK